VPSAKSGLDLFNSDLPGTSVPGFHMPPYGAEMNLIPPAVCAIRLRDRL